MPGFEDEHRYDAIISLPHHVSSTRPHMSAHDRAAQFSPFAALTGYGAAIKETARLTDSRIELSEDMRTLLDMKLQLISDAAGEPEITITYFLPDKTKSGGEYITAVGRVKRIDEYSRSIILHDGSEIPIEAILELESGLWGEML